jgi:DNA topoisomerase-1
MADAEAEKTTVDINISSRQEHFTATGEVIKFDGFLKVYIEGNDDADNSDAKAEGLLPKMATGDSLNPREINATERLTQQPTRYTEASLVKKLEELGIGRPSTYAPTISAIQQREYVEKGEREGEEHTLKTLSLAKGKITETERTEIIGADKGKIMPTDIGIVVNRFLTEYFPNILDYNFTASIEEKFDRVAEGKMNWTDEMKSFYSDFHPGVVEALNMRLEHKVGERVLGNDPVSGAPISVKIGRFGPLVQKGTNDGEEKPQFASLLKGQSVETITLEEALKLFQYPKNLGDFEEKAVSVAIGRFGPYVKHNNKFVSIPKDMNPATITLEEAIQLIENKRQDELNKIVKTFDNEPKLQILNGRYGVYIMYDGANYKIPKTITAPAELSLDECMDIIKNQEVKPKRTSRRATSTRKK